MQLIYQNPRSVMSTLSRSVDRRNGPEARSRSGFVPSVDIYEETAHFVVAADLPGVDAAAIDITVEDDLLTLRGERKLEASAEGAELRRSERPSGRFERSFRLPETATAEGVEAKYRDGVLKISIPKAKEATPYRIEVTAN